MTTIIFARNAFYAIQHCKVLTSPKLLYKIDDDVLLESTDAFQAHLADLFQRDAIYAGSPVIGYPSHRNLWHGWHLGKCRSQALELIGCQAPVASRYADGGYGYALGSKALKELSYAFFTHQSFLNISSVKWMPIIGQIGPLTSLTPDKTA